MAAMNSNNCDLWPDIYNLINSKHLQITIRWMPSHLRELHEKGKLPNGLIEGVTGFDVDANEIADAYAGEAAKAAQVPRGVTYQPIRYMYLITEIQKGWLQSY